MQKTLVIFLSIVIIFSLTGFTCTKKQAQEDNTTKTEEANSDLPASNLTNVDGDSVDSMITTNYGLAKNKAQEWKADAVLVNLTVKPAKNLAPNQATQTYIFGAASDPTNWFSFSISEQTSKYIRATIPKEDYLGTDVVPINTTYWKMNYLKAFQMAEENGGKNFRAANGNTEVVTTLAHMQPRDWLWWQVEYKSLTTGKKLIIKVNPNDNNVVDEEGNALSTDTSS